MQASHLDFGSGISTLVQSRLDISVISSDAYLVLSNEKPSENEQNPLFLSPIGLPWAL